MCACLGERSQALSIRSSDQDAEVGGQRRYIWQYIFIENLRIGLGDDRNIQQLLHYLAAFPSSGE